MLLERHIFSRGLLKADDNAFEAFRDMRENETHLYTQLLFLGTVDEVRAHLLKGTHVARGQGDPDAVDGRDLSLRLLDVLA